MKIKLLTTTLALIMTNAVFAANYPNPGKCPSQCPSLGSLKSVGVSNIRAWSNAWTGIERNNFDTSVKWTFVVGAFPGDTPKNEVLAKANAAISDLVYINGPKQDDDGVWACIYVNSKGIEDAAAFYPADIIPESQMARYLKR